MLQSCHACTWTHLSSSNKIQRNYMGLKITACRDNWGKFWTKIQRDQKTQLPLLKSLEQKQGIGSKSRVLHACPLHTPPPKPRPHPTLEDPWPHPYPHPIARKQLATPSGHKQLLLVPTPRCGSRGPNNPLPEFPVWPLINFY